MALTLYCEMINLARAQERRRHMTAELSKAGIPAKFFPAFDYKENGAEAMLEHCRVTGPWGPFHTNNMAITISHAQVWERFLETGDDLCLVMEDDVFLSPELSDWLNDLSWWPQNSDAQGSPAVPGTKAVQHHHRQPAVQLQRLAGGAAHAGLPGGTCIDRPGQ